MSDDIQDIINRMRALAEEAGHDFDAIIRKGRKKGMDNQRASKTERGLESYPTPPEAVLALMGVEALPKVLWEPACGAGNIVKVLRDSGRVVVASDIVDRGCPESEVSDFLSGDPIANLAWRNPNAIITNPPFSKATEFTDRALTYCQDVYMLLRLNYLEGGQRSAVRDQILGAKGGLRDVYVFRERLPMMHREGWEGKKASSMVTHAWFVWRRGFKGKAKVSRISWKEPKPPLPVPAPKLPKGRDPDTIDMFEGMDQ